MLRAARADTKPVLETTEENRTLIVERRDGESAERLLNRFRQMMQRAGVLRELKRRRHFTSKSEMRRMAQAKAARRARRNAKRAIGDGRTRP